MIPTRHDYYRRRALEHRRLALDCEELEQRAMHGRLGDAYAVLARRYRLRQKLRLKV
jgi:hypothetical protein